MRANQSFIIFFTHHIWGERVLWGAVFIIQTSYKMQCSKNFQNHLYGQPVLTFDKRQICEEILKELRFNVIEYLLSSIFNNGFISMCNLKKRLIRSSFWVLLRAMFMNAWKQTAKRWKLHFWDYQQSIKKYNSVEHLQRQQFSFTKTNEYLSVSKNPQVFTSKIKD